MADGQRLTGATPAGVGTTSPVSRRAGAASSAPARSLRSVETTEGAAAAIQARSARIPLMESDPAAGVGVLAALAAGLVSFLSPCVLPLVPGYLSAVTGVAAADLEDADWRRVLAPSPALRRELLGDLHPARADRDRDRQHPAGPPADAAEKIAAVLIIAMGVFFIAALFVTRLNREWHVDALLARAGRGGPLVAGAAFAIAWTPCVGPTLAAILSAAALSDSAGHGALPARRLLGGTRDPVPAHRRRLHPDDHRLRRRQAPLRADHGRRRRDPGRDGRLIWTGELFRLNAEAQQFLDRVRAQLLQRRLSVHGQRLAAQPGGLDCRPPDGGAAHNMRDRRGNQRPHGRQGARRSRRSLHLLRGLRRHRRQLVLRQPERPLLGLPVAAHRHLPRHASPSATCRWAEDYPDYPHHAQIREYLNRYADAFGLRDRIRFKTPVERAERKPGGGWRITLGDGDAQEFDFLVVGNGHHWDPRYPDFPGTSTARRSTRTTTSPRPNRST